MISLTACVDSEELTEDELEELADLEEESSDVTNVYTPFTGTSTVGSAATYSWHGRGTSYPAGKEDMRAYTLPSTIECSNAKSARTHLDVTSGCLEAVSVNGYSRARIEETSSGAFRAVALPFAGNETNPMKWSDQRNEFRFYYTGTSGNGVDPGVKAFVRYRDEYNLYVASWRMDGKVNIKRKQNGSYKTLAQINHPKPSTGAWHRIQFHAIGNRLDLYLDGTKVLTATDSAFSWGTSGIRTDSFHGAYLDDWTVR